MIADEDQFRHSSLREGLVEHLLVGEIMRHLWRRGCRNFEVLRPTTDAAGYDVLLAANGVLRHVQLKASTSEAKTARQSINIALAGHGSGCVVWARFDPDTISFTEFLWFGGLPSSSLPDLGDRIGTHTKPNADRVKTERPNIRVLPKGRFESLADISTLCDRLFGPL